MTCQSVRSTMSDDNQYLSFPLGQRIQCHPSSFILLTYTLCTAVNKHCYQQLQFTEKLINVYYLPVLLSENTIY